MDRTLPSFCEFRIPVRGDVFLTLLGRRLRHAQKNVDRRRSLVADDVIQTGLFNGGRGVTFPSFAFFSWVFCVCVCVRNREANQHRPSEHVFRIFAAVLGREHEN